MPESNILEETVLLYLILTDFEQKLFLILWMLPMFFVLVCPRSFVILEYCITFSKAEHACHCTANYWLHEGN